MDSALALNKSTYQASSMTKGRSYSMRRCCMLTDLHLGVNMGGFAPEELDEILNDPHTDEDEGTFVHYL